MAVIPTWSSDASGACESSPMAVAGPRIATVASTEMGRLAANTRNGDGPTYPGRVVGGTGSSEPAGSAAVPHGAAAGSGAIRCASWPVSLAASARRCSPCAPDAATSPTLSRLSDTSVSARPAMPPGPDRTAATRIARPMTLASQPTR